MKRRDETLGMVQKLILLHIRQSFHVIRIPIVLFLNDKNGSLRSRKTTRRQWTHTDNTAFQFSSVGCLQYFGIKKEERNVTLLNIRLAMDTKCPMLPFILHTQSDAFNVANGRSIRWLKVLRRGGQYDHDIVSRNVELFLLNTTWITEFELKKQVLNYS